MVKYCDFRIGDLFEKVELRFTKKKFNKNTDISKVKTKEYTLPLVNAKNGDNGIMYYGRESDFQSEELCIDIVNDGAVSTGNVYAQPQKTGVLYNAYLIKLKNFKPTDKILLFLATCLRKAIKHKFGYDNKAGWEKVENEFVKLPVDENGNPDYNYMHDYISELEEERISELEYYLIACGLNDYKLTEEEQNLLSSSINTKKFKIGDLFIVKGNPQLNKDSFEFSNDGEYPYFTRTVLNNGIAGYVKYLDEEHKIKGNSIAVGMLGMEFFYMAKDFYAGQFTKTIYPKFSNFNEELALYFISLFNKKSEVFKSVLVRDFEKTFLNDVIELPVKNNKVDFEYIQKFIKIQQKLAIKDVIEYKDSIVTKTKEVVG